jgi:hypothetical protein
MSDELVALWSDRKWRINNLYWIKNKQGLAVKFTMNKAQEQLFDNLHTLNVELKARQLGFSTFINIDALDRALFNDNYSVGVVSDTLTNSELFLDRMWFAYERLPDEIKRLKPVTTKNQTEIEFGNGSAIRVGTSHRGGTLQFLHVSELGKIAAKEPGRANEIKSGALNTVAPGGIVHIESTAEGRSGLFFDIATEAEKLHVSQKQLGSMDYKFHFFPWFMDPAYILQEDYSVPPELTSYFAELQDKGIKLSPEQKKWYAAKLKEQGDDMWKEYPSTSDEAFKAVKDGAYFARDMLNLRARKKVGQFEPVAGTPVNSFWDLGLGDYTSIWLHQQVAGRHRFVGFYQNSGEGLAFYFDWLDKWRARNGVKWGVHYAPHDIDKRQDGNAGDLTTRMAIARNLGFVFRKVERTPDKRNSIQAVRTKLPECEFDETACSVGIAHLESYSREWDDRLGTWKSHPRHDEHSHACLIGGTLIETNRGLVPIESIKKGDVVLSPNGFCEVENAGQTGVSNSLIKVKAFGQSLLCTPDHKIMCDRGFVRALDLRNGDRLYSGKEKTCSLIGLFSRVTNTSYRALITGAMSGAVKGRQTCIAPFGKMQTVQSQTGTISTTLMGTHSTTIFPTLFAYLAGNTSQPTQENALQKANYLHQAKKRGLKLLNGIRPKPEKNGTQNTAKTHGLTASVLLSVAKFAVRNLLRLTRINRGTARTIAGLDHVRLASAVPVYDLTIKGSGCYIANGIVVSNSDAFMTFADGYAPPTTNKIKQPEVKVY